VNVAIVGSRNWPWPAPIKEFVNGLDSEDVVVSGGAYGVDTIAENAAKDRGLETLIFLPDWEKHGKPAGFIRNQEIIEHSDKLVAFQYKNSKGTQHSINLAKKKGIPVTLVSFTEEHGMQRETL
jgi:hypothetical protein